jgi:hypothetical protein
MVDDDEAVTIEILYSVKKYLHFPWNEKVKGYFLDFYIFAKVVE